MRISVAVLLALFGSLSVLSGTAAAEIRERQVTLVTQSFNQAPPEEPDEEEEEGGSCNECYPPPR
jgi:hypothetical protein